MAIIGPDGAEAGLEMVMSASPCDPEEVNVVARCPDKILQAEEGLWDGRIFLCEGSWLSVAPSVGRERDH